MTEVDITQELVALERRALEAWGRGDPDPNLALLADDITYFDGGQKVRLDGRAAVQAYFEAFRGKALYDRFEIAGARVQAGGRWAVLTYRLLMTHADQVTEFHSTEVFERRPEGWRIIHSHFSKAKQA